MRALDITILHDIVVAAQALLERDDVPRPLPAAALFRAYDEILPKYGLDPDDDNHLSTLVFRVGGERGNESLIEKFRAILGRMGILLEFGDNTTVSFQTSNSPISVQSPCVDSQSTPRRVDSEYSPSYAVDSGRPLVPDKHQSGRSAEQTTEQRLSDNLNAPQREHLAPNYSSIWHNSPMPSITSLPIRMVGGPKTDGLTNDEPHTSPSSRRNPNKTLGVLPGRAALMPAMEVWQGPRSHGLMQRVQKDSLVSESYAGRPVFLEEQSDQDGQEAVDQDFPLLIDDKIEPGYRLQEMQQTSRELKDLEMHRLKMTEELNSMSLRRATRARKLFIASKFLNLWADKTARRLEREAVARRHMIRFRCFRSWCQTPDSQVPSLNSLRLVTAFQKLQRAMAQQEDQLRAVSVHINRHLRSKSLHRSIEQWQCYCTKHFAWERGKSRALAKVLRQWTFTTTLTVAPRQVAAAHKARRVMYSACCNWREYAMAQMDRSVAASQIGKAWRSTLSLRKWWDLAETGRRATTYRRCLFLTKASLAFNCWNLLNRAQAFTWRNEYLSVNAAFAKWYFQANNAKLQTEVAQKLFSSRSRKKAMSFFQSRAKADAALSLLQKRASLYISGTRVLSMFDRSVRLSEERERQALRRYLMRRYAEISSARKRRNFFGTLNHWKSLAISNSRNADLARNTLESFRYRRCLLSLSHWKEQDQKQQQQDLMVCVFHAQTWLAHWLNLSAQFERVYLHARLQWAASRQGYYYKEWSIVSLQQSGQAHTATTLRRRRARQQFRQALLRWKTTSQGSESLKRLRASAPPVGLAESLRSSWKAFATHRPASSRPRGRLDYSIAPIDTPTRWTGNPLPMSSSVVQYRMPPVSEGIEDPEPSSVDVRLVEFEASRHKATAPSPSTTPRGPVPGHLQTGVRFRNLSSARSRRLVTFPLKLPEPKPARDGAVASSKKFMRQETEQEGPITGTQPDPGFTSTPSRLTPVLATRPPVDVLSSLSRQPLLRRATSPFDPVQHLEAMSPSPSPSSKQQRQMHSHESVSSS